ncbi:putative LPS assembly protein LptD [Winogradskyella immobilis]|uniref:LPS-assembly protein LptD n=1 Tax=Winogradskyella immobilis TaxID=2816852 RepID=A0ABS8EQQ9_9FLAO|nr:putative LPS assembly protein LptD [Winogradskyella immobilis]MCC1485346.1 LPS-assembly protein LptD [Winogradskyella immobilis]MCG0017438.1 LPS-assembly protein LptD [Winogradskyella immobilis]
MAFQKPSHTFTKIHLKGLRTNSLKILLALSFTVFINTFSFAQDIPPPKKEIKPKTIKKDTVRIPADSTLKKLVNLKEQDTIKNDSINKPKELLEDITYYDAEGYVSLNNKTQKVTLHDNAIVKYLDMEITAGTIVIDNNTNLIYAGRLKDSTGYSQRPVFTQGQNVIEPDSIIFNKETRKAVIFNSRTEQSGFNIKAPITKRENDSLIFMRNARLTTSENLDDPEYEIIVSKLKFVPGKKLVLGPSHMEIFGVPTPIALPFAFAPLNTDSKGQSGVIFPTFGDDVGNDRGYNIQNGGYYFAISDYVDLAVLGDYYTNGSYGLRLESNYANRYRFNGNFSFRYENLLNSERGFPDFSQNTIYNIRWTHSQDPKASPNSRFSASVNLGSSQFFQQSVNQLNTNQFLNNTLSSSVSYSKTFEGEPQVNVSLTATHTQNSQTEQIDLTLPTFQTSVGRVFPFAPKNGTKKGILQNINFQYNSRGEYRISTTDSLFGTSAMFDDALAGIQHTIPITTNFKLFKHFSVSASSNYQENWTLNTINRFFDQATQEIVTTDVNGFDSFRTYNFSTSIGTTIYGLYDFEREGKNPLVQKIRHVIRPALTYTLSPAFDQFYETFEIVDADGTTTDEVEFTRFERSLFGAPSNRLSSSIGLSIGNNIEAKVRSKDSTDAEPKKIILLNNLNFSTSYDIAADSLQLAPVRMSGGTQILNNKMNINFSATLDPYALDNNNNKINTFNINNGGSLFRLTSANANISYSLSNKTFSKGNKDDEEEEESEAERRAREESIRSGGRADDLFGVSQDFSNQIIRNNGRDNPDEKDEKQEFYNYKIPWRLNLAYAVNYTNVRREDRISSHSLMFSGDIELSPKWSVGASSGYDLLNKGVTFTQLRFERDLLSWRMNFTWVPLSDRASWNFFIGIKSNFLQDLKYEQRRRPDQRIGN